MHRQDKLLFDGGKTGCKSFMMPEASLYFHYATSRRGKFATEGAAHQSSHSRNASGGPHQGNDFCEQQMCIRGRAQLVIHGECTAELLGLVCNAFVNR